MSKIKLSTIEHAKQLVPGFREGFARFEERVIIDQMSPSLLENYGRYLAHAALHFGKSLKNTLKTFVKVIKVSCRLR